VTRSWSSLHQNCSHIHRVICFCSESSPYRRVSEWIIGFIDTLPIELLTINKYSVIAFSTPYSSLLHTLVSILLFPNYLLPTDLSQSHCHCSTHEVFFAHPDSFLVSSSRSLSTEHSLSSRLQLSTPEIDSTLTIGA
jgi:hypothetical protein